MGRFYDPARLTVPIFKTCNIDKAVPTILGEYRSSWGLFS